MKGKTQAQWGILLLAVLYVNYVVYDNFFRPPPEPFWGDNANQGISRGPASGGPATSGTPLVLPPLDAFEDYFMHDTYNGYVQYDMDVDFWSDKGAKYFKKNVKTALEEGLKSSFTEIVKSNSKEITLPSSAKKHIVSKMLKQFVYTIKAHKLIDANFEVDFKFSPKNNSFANYNDELSSNQLVNLDNTGKLYNELNNANVTFPEKIISADVPNTGHLYQYMGGAITISAELLDTSWKLTKPIPNPKKNAVKGKIRLRKYYRVNNPGDLDLDSLFSGKKFKIDKTHFRKESGFKSPYITVDLIYKFNLDKMMPSKEKMVFHLGKIVSLDKSHDNIIKKVISAFKKSNDIKTANFVIEGESRTRGRDVEFKTQIRKLTYNFEKEKFEFGSSSIRTQSKDSSANDMTVRGSVKRNLLNKGQDDLIKALKLKLLFKSERI